MPSTELLELPRAGIASPREGRGTGPPFLTRFPWHLPSTLPLCTKLGGGSMGVSLSPALKCVPGLFLKIWSSQQGQCWRWWARWPEILPHPTSFSPSALKGPLGGQDSLELVGDGEEKGRERRGGSDDRGEGTQLATPEKWICAVRKAALRPLSNSVLAPFSSSCTVLPHLLLHST